VPGAGNGGSRARRAAPDRDRRSGMTGDEFVPGRPAQCRPTHNRAMSTGNRIPYEPSRDKAVLRRALQADRQAMTDRHARSMQLQEVLRVWLVARHERSIGAYWPIKGEFDALPALYRWCEAEPGRRIGLPVIDRETRQLRFHVWYPGCPMEDDAYGIPKPKDTEAFAPELLLVPCVGFGPRGVRLGYGGGFYDRTLAALVPRPETVGVAYAHGFIPWLKAEPHDVPLDAILTEEGVAWQRRR
jgi:5-formyltetrahydrofolate cyclo-ligase